MKKSLVEVVAPWVAALVYGSWGAFANRMFGVDVMLAAASAQGVFAFASTWGLAAVARAMLAIWRQRVVERLALLLSFFACSTILWAIPWSLHLLAGTENILLAMLPGLVIGHVYLAWLLRSLKQI